MNSKQFLAVALMSLVCTSATVSKPKPTLAKPKHMFQRGTVFSIQMELAANAPVQAASLTWQAFHLADPMTQRVYDEVSREQKGMATAFLCDADVAANNRSLEMSCKVPLNVADGTYYLTAVSIRTKNSERKYTWYDDLRAEVEVQIKGGEEVRVPHIESIMVK